MLKQQNHHLCYWHQIQGHRTAISDCRVQLLCAADCLGSEWLNCPRQLWLSKAELALVSSASRDSSPVMRSSSTLPVPHPNSAPPTPTRLTGANSDTEEEERGDLIQFYNNIYIEQIKEFALKYTSNGVSLLCFSLVNTSCFVVHAVKYTQLTSF